ncbi:MAG: GNAT family N-acetyltransferase [Myxococcales bacterium]|nr:GNAT family N-acetyltransferase [Myxococcales bacterium]
MLVRPAVPADAEAIRALDLALVADGRGEVREAADVAEVPAIRERLARGGAFVAELDGRVVGNGSLHVFTPARCRHVASLAVGVHPDAQRRGIGRALMRRILEEARAAGVHRLELYVRADNDRALALYRSLGFEVESVRRDFIRLADGTLLDDLCMVLLTP